MISGQWCICYAQCIIPFVSNSSPIILKTDNSDRKYKQYFWFKTSVFTKGNSVPLKWPLGSLRRRSFSFWVLQYVSQAESEKPRQQCWPESFCKKLIIGWRISGYFGTCPDTIQNIQIIYKVSGWTGKFSDDLKSVGMNWKVSRWCKKCIWIL